jgi:nitrite reductase/ring-hydroxylating ferredoxin subunit
VVDGRTKPVVRRFPPLQKPTIMPIDDRADLSWHRVPGPEGLDEGRVLTVTAGTVSIALSRFDGRYGALNNHCPHQGGPLGEGSIERGAEGKCWLRCPWHGWDFNPLTGESPGGHGDHL